MSRRSRTTLTFTLAFPLPAKVSQKEAERFIRDALREYVAELHAEQSPSPFAFLPLAEVVIKQTGRETTYF